MFCEARNYRFAFFAGWYRLCCFVTSMTCSERLIPRVWDGKIAAVYLFFDELP